jgi:tripartite-type tricarboxylate transporter receptor subunit TctC
MDCGRTARLFSPLFAVLLAWGPPAALAQQDAIRILHGSNAGAPQDVMLRILADEMTKAAGKPVMVEPRPGASGQIAMTALKQAPADGHTIFSDGTGLTSILQLPGHLHEWSDFEPLYRVQLDPFALYAMPRRYADLKTLLQDMRARPEAVRIGGYAVGGPFQIVLMLIAASEKATFTWIPYDSGTKAITAVLGNHMEAAMSNISVYPSFKEKMVVLAHTGESRIEQFPDVPTLKERCIDLVRYHWRGMVLKKGTPEPVTERTYALVRAGVKSQRFQAYLRDSATLDGTMSRPAMAEMLAEQARGDTAILRQLKLIQ